MKSVKRSQRLLTFVLLVFIACMVMLVLKIQKEASFYMSHNSKKSLGYVYDRNGDVLFDGTGEYSKYAKGHFTDVGNIIGDSTNMMSNTLVMRNLDRLNNYSFTTGLVTDGGKAALYTTLDHVANRKVYDAFGNRNGCAVAYDYVTGEILICVSKPSIDITKGYANIDDFESGTLMCKNMWGTVPGSTQKISTTAAGFETVGNVLYNKEFSCTGSYRNASGELINCHKKGGHGKQNLQKAFENSCNPYFAQLIEDGSVPLEKIIEAYTKMGYSVNGAEKTYISIDGITCEKASTVLTNPFEFQTQWGCIGQGDTLVSPVQLMLWQSAIVNGTGKMTLPHLIDKVTDVSGKTVYRAETSYGDEVFTSYAANEICKVMLENGKNNYSKSIGGYEIGLKSGTAQTKINGKDAENSLLTGFITDRRHPIAFCVVIEDKNGGNVKSETVVKVMLDALCS